ncbi:MAG: Tic20 family protein [Cyanobacteriota bacterium]|nr:Tic20 family protein [Cyanobacteriota bacterium]
MTWRGDIQPNHRIFGALPYLLPILAVIPFGASLFQTIPVLAVLFSPLFRLLPLATGMGSLLVFFLLLFLVIRNTRIAHFIRFNTMQALLLDIVVFLAGILMQLVASIFAGLPLGLLLQTVATTVFLGIVGVSLFAVVQSGRGRYAEVPVLSDAAYTWVRY